MLKITVIFIFFSIVYGITLKGCDQNQTIGYQSCCPKAVPAGLYFFHVPKAGGTSLRLMLNTYAETAGLKNCFHRDNVGLAGYHYYDCAGSVEERFSYINKIFRGRFINECNVLSSHNDATLLNILEMHDQSGSKQVVDVIALRKPEDLILSNFLHVKIRDSDRNLTSLNDPNWTEHYLDFIRADSNKMTKMLSGYPGCYDFQREIKLSGDVTEEHLQEALINLSQFCVIIIIEQPECGLKRLGQIFDKRDMELKQENKGQKVPFWPPQYLQVANESTQYDQILYSTALELNRQQCEML